MFSSSLHLPGGAAPAARLEIELGPLGVGGLARTARGQGNEAKAHDGFGEAPIGTQFREQGSKLGQRQRGLAFGLWDTRQRAQSGYRAGIHQPAV